jgi:hypothetical protein
MEVEDESGLSEENGIGNADGLGALFGHAQAQCRLQIQLELATAADGYGLIESPITLENFAAAWRSIFPVVFA